MNRLGIGACNRESLPVHCCYMSHVRVILLVLFAGACSKNSQPEPMPYVRSGTLDNIATSDSQPRGIAPSPGDAVHVRNQPPDQIDPVDDDVEEDNDSGDDTIATTDNDRDGDRILDAVDHCPDQPEDFDGFQDSDGCPDVDVDVDAIMDVEDKCPDSPSDNDFNDIDGCPEVL
jgi:hypothetical protein